MLKFVYVAFLLMVIQGILTYFQVVNYRKTIGRLKTKGIIGIGVEKGKLKAGRIVILVSNNLGEIITGEEMRGITVFSRFKKINEIEGQNIFKLKEKVVEKSRRNIALTKAIDNIEKHINSNPNEINL